MFSPSLSQSVQILGPGTAGPLAPEFLKCPVGIRGVRAGPAERPPTALHWTCPMLPSSSRCQLGEACPHTGCTEEARSPEQPACLGAHREDGVYIHDTHVRSPETGSNTFSSRSSDHVLGLKKKKSTLNWKLIPRRAPSREWTKDRCPNSLRKQSSGQTALRGCRLSLQCGHSEAALTEARSSRDLLGG